MDLVDASEALHADVRSLAEQGASADFESLALRIAEFQLAFSPGFARLVRSRGGRLRTLDDIPGVPTDAFRMTRVAVHPPELDVASFVTSGTTGTARGVHHFRTLDTYRALASRSGRAALIGDAPGPRTVVALAPDPGHPVTSSLGFMMQLFHEQWDGRDEHWLVSGDSIDAGALATVVAQAGERGEPLVVLATAFALVALVDALGGGALQAPAGSVVMVTGGFKGRTREVDGALLRGDTARAFGLAEPRVLGEYGMTELTSQLYEGTLPGGERAGPGGAFLEPPWLRVVPVDPVSLAPVPDGEVGLAKIIDLGNVDSAVAVQTQDRVRRAGAGIELLGRAPGATPRGCSLALESLLG